MINKLFFIPMFLLLLFGCVDNYSDDTFALASYCDSDTITIFLSKPVNFFNSSEILDNSFYDVYTTIDKGTYSDLIYIGRIIPDKFRIYNESDINYTNDTMELLGNSSFVFSPGSKLIFIVGAKTNDGRFVYSDRIEIDTVCDESQIVTPRLPVYDNDTEILVYDDDYLYFLEDNNWSINTYEGQKYVFEVRTENINNFHYFCCDGHVIAFAPYTKNELRNQGDFYDTRSFFSKTCYTVDGEELDGVGKFSFYYEAIDPTLTCKFVDEDFYFDERDSDIHYGSTKYYKDIAMPNPGFTITFNYTECYHDLGLCE